MQVMETTILNIEKDCIKPFVQQLDSPLHQLKMSVKS